MSEGGRPALPGFLVRHRSELLLVAGLALVVGLLFADYLFSDDLLYGSDSIPSGLFFRGLLVDFVRDHGELPRWNPFILGGLPFLDATHGDTFFPTSLLQFVFPVYRALGHKLVLHVFLAGVFMAFYLRSIRLRPPAVAVGALAYMLSPVSVSYVQAGQDGKMYVASLAPLVLGLLERGMRSGSLRTFLGLGIAIGLVILSAQIQMAYHCLWFLGALFVVRLVGGPATGEPPAPRGKTSGLFAVAVGLGLLVAAIQLLPAVAYVKHPAGFSVRSERTDYEHASSWSLHPEEIASLVVPEFCNAPKGYWGRNIFKLNSDYMGILTLFLAGLALARRRDATRWFLGGLGVFAVLYAMGGHTPLHRLFYAVVPQVKLFRAPPLVMFGAAFGFSALAAHAVHDLDVLDPGSARQRARLESRVLAWGLGTAAAIAIAGLAAGPFTTFWTDLLRPGLDDAKRGIQAANLPAFRAGAFAAAGLLAVGVALVRGRIRGGVPPAVALSGLLAVTAVDLARVDRRFIDVRDPGPWIRPGPLVAGLMREAEREKFRVAPVVGGLRMNELGYFGIESTFGFHDNELAWYRELRTAPAAGGLLATDGESYPLLQMLNVKYVVHDRPGYPNPLPVPGYLARFRLVDEYEVLADRSRIVPRLLETDFDVTRRVVLEEDPGFVSAGSSDPASGGRDDPPGRVVEYAYEGNEIRVDVEAERDCLLVHAENWFPYWKAFEDGHELPVLRANGTIRAIPLGPGRHRIELRFRSGPYELGKRISLAALVGVVLVVGTGAVRRRAGA